MRWENEAEKALTSKGFEVVQRDGVDDWQGWGVLLGRAGDVWAVLSWSYGSCNYCDAYEDMPRGEVVASLAGDVEDGMNEADARARFDARKGW